MFAALLRDRRRRKVAAWTSAILVTLLVAGALTAYLKYRSVWDSIHRVPVTGLYNRPPKYDTSAMNILLFGVDTRAGLTRRQQIALHVGRNQGEVNTDTIMVVHISPGHGAMTAVSIPRDTEVPVYTCPAGHHRPGQQANPNARVLINSVFAAGGPSCLIETVEQQTGIYLDHFIQVNFTGFVKVINDVGGVNVCLPFPVNDSYSGLKLSQGHHHINGVKALEFWRTRYSIGNGTDLQRIQRDQYLVAQLAHAILHSGLLSSPSKLLSVIGDVASALTTDNKMSQSDMLHIAESMHAINSTNIHFVTAPNEAYPPAPAHVQLKQPQAGRLFHAIAHDTKLPSASKSKSPKGHGHPSAKPSPSTAPPADIKVLVLNGSGASGIAGQTANALRTRGFVVLGTGDATGAGGATDFYYTTSVIEYASSAELPAVNTLKKLLSNVTVQRNPGVTAGTIHLILGSSFSALATASPGAAPSGKASSAKSVSKLAKKDGGISGSVACRGDRSAFTGPNSP